MQQKYTCNFLSTDSSKPPVEVGDWGLPGKAVDEELAAFCRHCFQYCRWAEYRCCGKIRNKQSRNFFGGCFKSPLNGCTIHRLSTRPRVFIKPHTLPSAYNEIVSPMCKKLELLFELLPPPSSIFHEQIENKLVGLCCYCCCCCFLTIYKFSTTIRRTANKQQQRICVCPLLMLLFWGVVM